MQNNKGFIATTLIYSFLLLFATLVVVIIGNYNYYQLTLNRYNRGIMDALDKRVDDKYVTLYNEINNGNFEVTNSANSWSLSGSVSYTNEEALKDGYYSLKLNNNGATATVISNDFDCSSDNYYYVGYNLFTDGRVEAGMIGLYNQYAGRNIIRSMSYVFSNWDRQGFIGKSTMDGTCNLRIDYANNSSTRVYIDNFVVINVTEIVNKLGSVDINALASALTESSSNAYIPYFSYTYNYDIEALKAYLS